MFITKLSLPRRTFLRGVGVALGLPLLDAMVPALTATAKTAAQPLRRLGFVYVPHGVIMDQWTPATEGAGFEFTPILKPLEPLRDSLVVVSNLARPEAGFETQHAGAAASWLAGMPPKRTEGPDFQVGVTIDQVVAKAIGQDTTFPSLEVATEDFTGLVGACSPGYSCAYVNTPQLADADDAAADGDQSAGRVRADVRAGGNEGAAARADAEGPEHPRLRQRRSRRSPQRLGPRDRARLSEYLDDVREIERRIQRAEQQTGELTDPGCADRRARLVRGARRADVRPAGAGLPGRPDARLHLHDGARVQPAHVSADRRERAAPHHLASRQQPGADCGARQGQHLSRRPVREIPGAPAGASGRRRLAARSLAASSTAAA